MFKTYDKTIRKTVLEKSAKTDWKEVLNYHQVMLLRIQHERLIHLLVTIFVGLVMSLVAFTTIITQNPVLIWLVIPLVLLFIGYLLHYRFLENTTQSWYKMEDKIRTFL